MDPHGENNTRLYIDPSDPLFLHPSDHPGMILVSKPLDGSNFAIWKKSIAIALSAKNKLSFINGEIAKPAVGSRYLNTRQRCNDMITSWLLNSLSPDIAKSVLYSESASQIWKELNDRYGQASGAKLYQLQKDISSIDQNNHDITSYYTKFKRIWDEFSGLRSFPPCTCGCLQSMMKFEEEQRLIQFLMGLNADYNAVRGSILMMTPLPSLNQAYSILIQEEKQREVHASRRFISDSAALHVANRFQGDAKGGNDIRKNVVCHHCKKPGHIASRCYRLICFLKDFKFTKGKRLAGNVVTQGQDYTAATQDYTAVTSGEYTHAPAVGERGMELTHDEYNQVMKLLNRAHIQEKQSVNSPSQSIMSHANFVGPFNEGANGGW